MEKINIVVLTDDLDLRIDIKNLVDSEQFAVSGFSGISAEGRTKVVNLFPEIVICAIRGEVSDSVFQFVQELLSAVHDCVVMLANDSITVDLVNKAAEYGIRKVLAIDDVTPEEFAQSVSTAYRLELQRTLDTNEGKKVRSKVISYFGGKGGTGKTTVAINTAARLAKLGKHVMLLDLDLEFGDVTIALDIDTKDSIVDLVQDREGITIENINRFAVDHRTGMNVLCAPKSPELAEFVTAQHIEKIIDIMRPYYEYIIIDLPASFNDVSIVACENSEEIYLVYCTDILSLRNARVCFSILDQLHQRDKIKFILNMDEKGLIRERDFVEMFQTPMFATIPMDLKAARAAINKGTPMIISHPKSEASRIISSMADRIVAIHSGVALIGSNNKKKKKPEKPPKEKPQKKDKKKAAK